MRGWWLFWLALLAACQSQAGGQPQSALRASQLAVIVNEADPKSVAIGEYYLQTRRVPAENLVRVRLPVGQGVISPEAFDKLKQQVESRLGPEIQAILMVWTTPYAVGCNAITAAMTLGYDAAQCTNTCAAGKPSPYFNSSSRQPYTDHKLRLSMLLPSDSVEQAKVLIDRGALSTFRLNQGTAYFLETSDKARNSRAAFFPPPGSLPPLKLEIKRLQAESLRHKDDVMIYQTGRTHVPDLETLNFLPGALADHLTSAGGILDGKGQMSSLRWLEAGATASYGTVSEPCNHWQKFPNSIVLLRHYLAGQTAIEAYWKSVAWPAQGVFIGEPLAAPYCPQCVF